MIEPFLALQASAGSGKTFALSVRYIALVLCGESIKDITALTFTKKAASEMKERIVSTFLNLHKDEKNSECSVLCDMLEMSKDALIARRDERAQEFLQSELKITTFDAFFSSILRSFSLNLGLLPDFESKDKHGEILQSEFIKLVANDKTLLEALARYIWLSQRAQSSFFDTLHNFYENFNEIKFSPFSDPNAGGEAMQILANLREFAIQNGCSQRGVKTFEASRVEEIFKKSFLCKDSLDYWDYKKIFSPELDEKFSMLKDALTRYARHLEAQKLSELNEFLQSYDKAVFALNSRLNELTFCDITKQTHKLLGKDKDLQMLYFRLDARIKHLLIDEFQDTNVAQYEIMLPLIAEIVAGYGQSGLGSFFYVGDIKQSIYRFRGGKKELFARLMDDFRQIKGQNLDHNYRSAPNLVEFVNTTFTDKIKNYTPQISSKTQEGFLKIIEQDELITAAIAEVQKLVQMGVPKDDIAVLCWKNDDASAICEGLAQLGIEAKDEGAVLLKNSPAVFALVNYAKFCLFGDEIYRQNALAFIDAKFERLKLDLSKTAGQNLLYLAQKAGVSLQNLDVLKLLSLANKTQNLINFIFKFENSEEKGAQNSAVGVKAMTVHKSKGLEFSHVVLLDKVNKDKPNTQIFICEYDINSGYQLALKLDNREFLDQNYADLRQSSIDRDKEEEINKLYVAMTRAKDSLIIIKKSQPSGSNPSYFSPYLSNGKEICYLNLATCQSGNLIVAPSQPAQPKRDFMAIWLANVSRDKATKKTQDDEKNLHAIYFGLALHYLLEMSVEFSSIGVENASVAMRNKFGKILSPDDLADVQNRAKNLVNNAKFQELIAKKQITKEQALNYKGEQKQIDLLCQNDDELVVIDYKSSNFSREKNIDQVREYMRILSEIYPQKRVRGVLFYALRYTIEVVEI